MGVKFVPLLSKSPGCAWLYCRPQHLDPGLTSRSAEAETKLSLHIELTSVCQSDLVTSTFFLPTRGSIFGPRA